MDPEETLDTVLALAEDNVDADGDLGVLAEGVLALHRWIISGGHLPGRWHR